MLRKIASLCIGALMIWFTGRIIVGTLEPTTISLLSGAMVGILIAAPCAVLVTLALTRKREEVLRNPPQTYSSSVPALPPGMSLTRTTVHQQRIIVQPGTPEYSQLQSYIDYWQSGADPRMLK